MAVMQNTDEGNDTLSYAVQFLRTYLMFLSIFYLYFLVLNCVAGDQAKKVDNFVLPTQ